jgi:hypothetical protein
LLFSKLKIPISSVTSNEKADTLIFQNLEDHYSLKLFIIKVDDLVPFENCELSNPCFVLYFGDKDGKILPVKNSIESTKKNIYKVANASNCGVKSGYFYKSSTLENTVDPIWNDLVEIRSSTFPDVRNLAKYIIIEFWDKTVKNAYECIGEVYISIFSAINESTIIPPTSKKAVQLSKNMKFKSKSITETDRVYLGSLHYYFTTNEMNQQYLSDKIKLGNHNLKLI